MRRIVPLSIVCLAALPALAQTPATDAQCEALTKLTLPYTTVAQATAERSGTFHEERGPGGKPRDHADLPPYCRVVGTATPVAGSKIGAYVTRSCMSRWIWWSSASRFLRSRSCACWRKRSSMS